MHDRIKTSFKLSLFVLLEVNLLWTGSYFSGIFHIKNITDFNKNDKFIMQEINMCKNLILIDISYTCEVEYKDLNNEFQFRIFRRSVNSIGVLLLINNQLFYKFKYSCY